MSRDRVGGQCVCPADPCTTVLGTLLSADVARLGELIAGSEQGPVAFLLAAAGFGSTFGGLMAGTATFLPPD